MFKKAAYLRPFLSGLSVLIVFMQLLCNCEKT
jgi:hypothetical protein